MNFNTKDTKTITTAYLNFLKNLKQFIQENDFSKIEKIIPVMHYLLENGYFTDHSKMILDHRFDFLNPQSSIDLGVQVMHGICNCQHANTLLENLLKQLNYQDVKMSAFLTDESGNWKRMKNFSGANYITASISQNQEQIFLDAYMGITFKADEKGNVIYLDEPLTTEERIICTSYEDKENIKTISKVLKKYYCLRKLGIKNVYDEEKYGIE